MITISPIAVFTDNYIWLLHNSAGQAVIVDPGTAEPVIEHLTRLHLTLTAILVTHHHWDHIDGIPELLKHYDVPVYGPDSSRIPHITHTVAEGDVITLFSDWAVDVIEVPGHTRDHIAYLYQQGAQPLLFCGDTLFAAGCGRLFDGSHEQLFQSLQRLNRLPKNTLIYCTHEYTLSNLRFAQTVEPNNVAIAARIAVEEDKRAHQQATLPTHLAL